jgi:predicted transcriptional regulator
METAVLSVRLPPALLDRLELLANRDRRPLSNLVRNALSDFAEAERGGERSNRGRAA